MHALLAEYGLDATPEMAEALGIAAGEVTPNDLMRAILAALNRAGAVRAAA